MFILRCSSRTERPTTAEYQPSAAPFRARDRRPCRHTIVTSLPQNRRVGAPRILVVDDDPGTVDLLRLYLENAGFAVDVAVNGLEALRLAREEAHAMLVLDVMLPGLDGFAVCRAVRRESAVPVILLTARTTEDDRLAGLGLGADDYVTKPFSPRELVARVRAILRRTSPEAALEAPRRVGDLTLDPEARSVVVAGREVRVTPTEYRLLAVLAERAGKTYTREELAVRIFPEDSEALARTIDAHVMRLRKKLEENPSEPVRLVTVFGAGYRLKAHP
ncbi:MAG: response regulator transcription factor [Acidobacteria bacterium]|nr:response regulator transcription factor [Acidobacteriota bacterium]